MKKSLAVAVGIVLACVSLGRAEVDWVVDVLPGSLLASFEGDEFSLDLYRGVNSRDAVVADSETTSLLSVLPTVGAGASIELGEVGRVAILGGGGYLINHRFSSLCGQIAADVTFNVKEDVAIGPHLGLGYFDNPDWWGDGQAEFSDTMGVFGGLRITLGDKVAYMLSLDYYSVSFDVDAKEGTLWVPSDDEMDMSGLAVQFGLRARF